MRRIFLGLLIFVAATLLIDLALATAFLLPGIDRHELPGLLLLLLFLSAAIGAPPLLVCSLVVGPPALWWAEKHRLSERWPYIAMGCLIALSQAAVFVTVERGPLMIDHYMLGVFALIPAGGAGGWMVWRVLAWPRLRDRQPPQQVAALFD